MPQMTIEGIARGFNMMRHNPLAPPLSKQPRFGIFCKARVEEIASGKEGGMYYPRPECKMA